MREDRLRVWEVLKGIGSRCDIKKWRGAGENNMVGHMELSSRTQSHS